jgi:dephospho-CoA kinase
MGQQYSSKLPAVVQSVMASRVGLTGGIGSGKSTVANLFQQHGIDIIDADQIARQLTRPGTPQFERIREVFGGAVIDDSGLLDRGALGDIVFKCGTKREILETILHPPIREHMLERSKQSNSPYCILEIPLLIESGQYREMDRVLVVTCKTSIRKQRLQQNRDIDLQTINRILDSQMSDEERCAEADDVIVNDSTIASLEKQVSTLHKTYCAMFGGLA